MYLKQMIFWQHRLSILIFKRHVIFYRKRCEEHFFSRISQEIRKRLLNYSKRLKIHRDLLLNNSSLKMMEEYTSEERFGLDACFKVISRSTISLSSCHQLWPVICCLNQHSLSLDFFCKTKYLTCLSP